MGEGSNTAARIAELRRRITANKGIAKRASDSAFLLRCRMRDAEDQIARDRREIENMGGKVRR